MEGINFNQLEHLQAKYGGTGSADTTRQEWLETQQKDTCAAFIGNAHLVKYVAVATGECSARTKLHHLESMVLPMRPPQEPAYQDASVDINKAVSQLESRHGPAASEQDEQDMDLS